MENNRKVDVFGAFRPFIHLLNNFDPANFRNPDGSIATRHIYKTIAFLFGIFGFVMSMSSAGWFCISVNFDLSVCAVPLGVFINPDQLAITYISFRYKLHEIRQFIKTLSEMIHGRKCKTHHFFVGVRCEFMNLNDVNL